MIIDSIKNYKLYAGISSNFREAFEFLASGKFSMEPGRYDLSNGMYYMHQSYETKPLSEGVFETHSKYIDLQFIVEGNERHDYTESAALKQRVAYNAEKDVTLYDGEGSSLFLKPGTFAVYFPEDGHRPNLRTGSSAEKVKKIIVKIPV